MRIAIDMQGAQTESRFRGIGRYSLSLAQAIVRNCGEHEIILVLNGLFTETIEPIRAMFDGMLAQENIRVWYAPGPIREADPSNRIRREVAERIREAFLTSLQPDIVLVTSLFEGLGDDAVTSVGIWDTDMPVAVILYDLIPLISPDIHFKSSKLHQDYYNRKIASLKRSQRLLAISDSARQEALGSLGFDAHNVVNISGACDTSFRVLNLSVQEKKSVCFKYGIQKPFVMYTGGADERKNLHRLIQAYSQLSTNIRKAYQLVFVGKMPEGNVNDFLNTAKNSGLASDEVLFLGYVEDDDLIKLYNSCTLFVFPSLHEGFGIPPLEAMLCGAPVIAANSTSLPEVIGRKDALFDPGSVISISDKIKQVLTDEAFRKSLIAHGQIHAKTFSWDESAKRALKVLQDFDHGAVVPRLSSLVIEKTSIFRKQAKKILLVKLDHMGDFILAIPALVKLKAKYPYANIDIVVGSWNVPIAQKLQLFDNIYTFDFFKKKSSESASASESEENAVIEKLGNYDIAIDLRRQRDTRFFLVKTHANLKVGYETFDKDIDTKLDVSVRSYPDVPHETTPLNSTPITVQMLKLINSLPNDVNDYVSLPDWGQKKQPVEIAVAIFPNAGNDVKEWGKSNYMALVDMLEQDSHIQAINVYFASSGEAVEFGLKSGGKLNIHTGLDFSALVDSLSENSICVANNSFGVHLGAYLGLVVIGIYAGHETVSEWAPVFGNSFAIHVPAACSPCHIANKTDCARGMFCLTDISVVHVYNSIVEAVQSVGQIRKNDRKELLPTISLRKSPDEIIKGLINSIVKVVDTTLNEDERIEIARAISHNHPSRLDKKQLFLDISELVQHDAKSGIQRVVRSIMVELLARPPENYCVEPVYALSDKLGYRYARKFTARFVDGSTSDCSDDPVEVCTGDIFLGLDLSPHIVPLQNDFFTYLREIGVQVYFVVYDLLPVKMPQMFPEGPARMHGQWLASIAQADGVVCISRAVADEMREWLEVFGPNRMRPLKLGWFHLGADIVSLSTCDEISFDANKVLKNLQKRPSFLSVGTIEPRKGYEQMMAAFEQLWQEKVDVNLTLVGKRGWHTDEFITKLNNHRELGKRLFWLEAASDEYLEKVYAASNCFVAASVGEGFGLPLVEAARHRLPIIARDIPVFQEVAGGNAFYFSGLSPEAMADAVKQWLALYESGTHPKSDDMPWMTWKESTQQMLDVIMGGKWYQQWMPDGVFRYWGSDPRFSTRVGLREGRDIVTTNKAGHLLYGPYLSLPTGQYSVSIFGTLCSKSTNAVCVDLAVEKGTRVLADAILAMPDAQGCLLSIDVFLGKPCTDLEIRVLVREEHMVRISMVCIKPVHLLDEKTVSHADQAGQADTADLIR